LKDGALPQSLHFFDRKGAVSYALGVTSTPDQTAYVSNDGVKRSVFLIGAAETSTSPTVASCAARSLIRKWDILN
jgi:hypothetical protein